MTARILRFLAFVLVALNASAAEKIHWMDEAPSSTYAHAAFLPLATMSDQGHTVRQLNAGQYYGFYGNPATIKWHARVTYLSTRVYAVYQDGVRISEATLSDAGDTWKTVTLATGLNTSSNHRYEIVCDKPATGSEGAWYDGGPVMEEGTFASIAYPEVITVCAYGDSIRKYSNALMGAGPTVLDRAQYTDLFPATYARSMMMWVAAVPGGKINPTGRDNTGTIPAGVKIIFIGYGTNDKADMPAGAAALTTATGAMFDSIATAHPLAKVVVLKPLEVVGPDPYRETVGTILQTAANGRAGFTYFSTDGWITRTTAFMPDGLHPNDAGYAQVMPRLVEVLDAVWPRSSATVTTFNAVNVTLSP